MSNFANFLLGGNFLKKCLLTFLYFGLKIPMEGSDELPKDGFDLIALRSK